MARNAPFSLSIWGIRLDRAALLELPKPSLPPLLEGRSQCDPRLIAESGTHFGRILPNDLLDLLEQLLELLDEFLVHPHDDSRFHYSQDVTLIITRPKEIARMSDAILSLPPPPADMRLSYGPLALQVGDLRLPATPPPHPLAILVHGGFWRARYNLAHLGHLAAALTAQGIATWSVEYRRIGDEGGGWPGTLLDVAAAADYVRSLAPVHKLDLDRVIALGHSAGGHLALWLAGRSRIPAGSPLYSATPLALRGTLSLGGVVNLSAAWELNLGDHAVEQLMGGSPTARPERYTAADPYILLPLGVPQILIHGTEDVPVPYVIAERYAAHAGELSDRVELITLQGMGHFEPIDPRSAAWPAVARAARGLLGQNAG